MPLPPLNEIQITNDWNDDSHEVSVCVIYNNVEIYPAMNQYTGFDYDETIEIHVFVKQISEERPTLIAEVEQEISRIIMTNTTTLKSEGIALMLPTSFSEVTDPDNSGVYWHSMMMLRLLYRKFVV